MAKLLQKGIPAFTQETARKQRILSTLGIFSVAETDTHGGNANCRGRRIPLLKI